MTFVCLCFLNYYSKKNIARISMKYAKLSCLGSYAGFDPTVPNWVSIIIPLLNMLMTIIVGEFVYSKREHHSLTDAFAVLIYFLLDGLQVWYAIVASFRD